MVPKMENEMVSLKELRMDGKIQVRMEKMMVNLLAQKMEKKKG